MRRLAAIILSSAIALVSMSAWAADDYAARDGQGNLITIKAKDTTGNNGPKANQIVPSDVSGNPITSAIGTPTSSAQTVQGAGPTAAPVTVAPVPLTTTNVSSTTNVTPGTFNSVQTANTNRRGCLIQNKAGNGDTMWVYVGSIGSATELLAYQLGDGKEFNCVSGLILRTDQISITSNGSSDAYYAEFQ